MINKRVQLWNCELAYRIESQLTTHWDRLVFRQLLSQNELDERRLRSMLRLWCIHSDGKTFCEFLVDRGLILVETRNVGTMNALANDSGKKEVLVSLPPKTGLEPTRACILQLVVTPLVNRMFAKPLESANVAGC